MREIKFRAWNGEKMIYGVLPWNDRAVLQCYKARETTPAETVMQFSGLKDNHGVEIYEGDIYKTSDEHFQVMFVNGAFVGGKSADRSCPLAWNDDKPDWPWSEQQVTVIGNIYEHPELLK